MSDQTIKALLEANELSPTDVQQVLRHLVERDDAFKDAFAKTTKVIIVLAETVYALSVALCEFQLPDDPNIAAKLKDTKESLEEIRGITSQLFDEHT